MPRLIPSVRRAAMSGSLAGAGYDRLRVGRLLTAISPGMGTAPTEAAPVPTRRVKKRAMSDTAGSIINETPFPGMPRKPVFVENTAGKRSNGSSSAPACLFIAAIRNAPRASMRCTTVSRQTANAENLGQVFATGSNMLKEHRVLTLQCPALRRDANPYAKYIDFLQPFCRGTERRPPSLQQ